MTVEQLLNEIDRLNIQMLLFRWDESCFVKERWRLTLTGKADGIELKVEGNGADLHTVLLEGVGKFTRIMRQGIPEFKPALEYKSDADGSEYRKDKGFTDPPTPYDLPF